MKKLYLAAAVMLIAVAAQAQTALGIKGGVNFSALRGTGATKMLPRVNAGVFADFPLGHDLFIEPGLYFEGKGGKSKGSADYKTKLSYLTLPVDLVFKPQLGKGHFILGAGPYIGYGLGGKIKGNDAAGHPIAETNPFKGDNKLSRFDFGGHGQIGYEFASGLSVGLTAEVSALNLNKGKGSGTYRNTSLGVTVGYTLHR